MIGPFVDSVIATAVYVSPDYVVTPRSDPADADGIIILKLRDEESFRVHGAHQEVAEKLSRAP